MKSKLLALVFLAGSAAFAGPRFFVGVGFGAPRPVAVYAAPPAPFVTSYVPVAPGPGYSWVAGYWQPVGAGWHWRTGYWAARPYARASWVAPRYYGRRYYGGYWRR
jgi:hypothetical protein